MGSKSAGAASSSSPSSATVQHEAGGAHVLLLPYPGAQGHTNPLLQFGRRLAYLGLRPTLVCSRYVLSTTPPPGEPFRVAAISDGFDDGGAASCPDLSEYWRQLQAVGSETLAELLRSEASEGRPVRVLVYDPHLAWARRVAKAAGVAAAAFLSQPCSVDLIYGELWAGRLALPVTDGAELSRRGLLGVELGPDDVPPFAAKPDWCPAITQTLLRQFEGLEDADDVLVNSFRGIEPKVSVLLLSTCLLFCSIVNTHTQKKIGSLHMFCLAMDITIHMIIDMLSLLTHEQETDYMERTWRAKAIGPCLPSFYLDDERLPSNKTYGFDLFTTTVSCMSWLDKQAPCSVVLVSYGTVSEYDETQLEELGNGLCNSEKPFLWVVRSNKEHKLSDQLRKSARNMASLFPGAPNLRSWHTRLQVQN